MGSSHAGDIGALALHEEAAAERRWGRIAPAPRVLVVPAGSAWVASHRAARWAGAAP